MQNKWEEYREVVNHLAHVTIRKWMIGIDIEDVKQSIWTEYFRICDEVSEDIPMPTMILRLRKYASTFRSEEGEYKFGKKQSREEIIASDISGKTHQHWRKVKHLWESFLLNLPTRDATILRFASQGTSNVKIAETVKLSVKRVESIRSQLIKKFREEVENSVQTDIS